MSYERVFIHSSDGPYVRIVQFMLEGNIGNIPVELFSIWTSGSRDVV